MKPYSDDPNNSGKLLCTEEELAASVKASFGSWGSTSHTCDGRQSNRHYPKRNRANSKRKSRFRIEQAAVLNKDLVKRLKKQNVVVSVQPKVISTEFSVWSAIKRLGKERARWLHPLKTLIDEGVKVAGGSDCPMEPLSPLLGIQEVVLRAEFPEQRLKR